jgi:hypothetical protein
MEHNPPFDLFSLGQPADEEEAPLDDPMEHNPPFDFFSLGQPANQGQFHQE